MIPRESSINEAILDANGRFLGFEKYANYVRGGGVNPERADER